MKDSGLKKKYIRMWITAVVTLAAVVLIRIVTDDTPQPFWVNFILCVGPLMRSITKYITAYTAAFPKAKYSEYNIPLPVDGHPEINIWVFNCWKWIITLLVGFIVSGAI